MPDAPYLTPAEVMEEAHELRERYVKRQLSDAVLTQMFSFRLENANDEGRIPLREYGLHDLPSVLQKTGAMPLYGGVKKDVLDTTFTSGQGGGALARTLISACLLSNELKNNT